MIEFCYLQVLFPFFTSFIIALYVTNSPEFRHGTVTLVITSKIIEELGDQLFHLDTAIKRIGDGTNELEEKVVCLLLLMLSYESKHPLDTNRELNIEHNHQQPNASTHTSQIIIRINRKIAL